MMEKRKVAISTLGMTVGMAGMVNASPAAACQGPQFESEMVLFSSERQAEVSKDMVQYRVRVTSASLRDVYVRDLINVQRLADEPVATGKIEKAVGRLKVIKPVGTSCSWVAVPEPGIYYITGSIPLGRDGDSVRINGAELFAPQFTSRKAFPDFR